MTLPRLMVQWKVSMPTLSWDAAPSSVTSTSSSTVLSPPASAVGGVTSRTVTTTVSVPLRPLPSVTVSVTS